MSKISIYGYAGTNEDLKRELAIGLTVEKVWDMPNGKGVYVEYTDKPTGGRPPRVDKELIKAMRAEGKSYGEIAKAVGCSKTYAVKVCKE